MSNCTPYFLNQADIKRRKKRQLARASQRTNVFKISLAIIIVVPMIAAAFIVGLPMGIAMVCTLLLTATRQ